jgi:hypothetical protein
VLCDEPYEYATREAATAQSRKLQGQVSLLGVGWLELQRCPGHDLYPGTTRRACDVVVSFSCHSLGFRSVVENVGASYQGYFPAEAASNQALVASDRCRFHMAFVVAVSGLADCT